MKLYRYERQTWGMFDEEGFFNEKGTPRVKLREFNVRRETEKSYFIYKSYKKDRRISKTAKSTYAYNTKEKALDNFKHRCRKNLSYCRMNHTLAKVFLEYSKTMTI